ncbi:unnamed protein product, partial [Laminaria digitata]
MAAMVAAVMLIVFQFWVMHHHNPKPHSNQHPSSVPGMAPSGIPGSRNVTKLPGKPAVVRNSMVEPVIGARHDSAVPGTQPLGPLEEPKDDAESLNGGAFVFEPPKPPLVLPDDAAAA